MSKSLHTGYVVRYDNGDWLAMFSNRPVRVPSPTDASHWETLRHAEMQALRLGDSCYTITRYTRSYWRRLCRAWPFPPGWTVARRQAWQESIDARNLQGDA